MIKKLWMALGLMLLGGNAMAGELITDVGYSSFSVVGIKCSSGAVAVQLNASRPAGFSANVGGYRVQNQDSADAVWIGGVSVSTMPAVVTAASIANLGEKIASGSNSPVTLGKDYSRATSPLAPIYCRAEDAAGADGVIVSVFWFGY